MKKDLYRHYKGGLYELLMYAIDENSRKTMVVYKSTESSVIFVRPLQEFKEKFKEEPQSTSVQHPDIKNNNDIKPYQSVPEQSNSLTLSTASKAVLGLIDGVFDKHAENFAQDEGIDDFDF